MPFALRMFRMGITLVYGLPALLLGGCDYGDARQGDHSRQGDPTAAVQVTEEVPKAPLEPTEILPIPLAAGTNSVMVYIKVGIGKKFGMLARVVGGKRDSQTQDPEYDVDNAWWDNPLVAYADPPILKPDVVASVDAQPMTGMGASDNVTIRLVLVPHANVSVKTIPKTDAIKGVITGTLSTTAAFYDGEWVEMAREKETKIVFSFDTRNSNREWEVLDSETRTVPPFELERYTRDKAKWEPKSIWPSEPKSGDWNVVIYVKDPVLTFTRYRDTGKAIEGQEEKRVATPEESP